MGTGSGSGSAATSSSGSGTDRVTTCGTGMASTGGFGVGSTAAFFAIDGGCVSGSPTSVPDKYPAKKTRNRSTTNTATRMAVLF